ncbi:MAG: YheC/YheD family protein [Candidatus Pristimantibacillus sp.]
MPLLVKVGIFVASIDWQTVSNVDERNDAQPSFPEQSFIKKLCKAADSFEDMDAFVFSPNEYNSHTGILSGFRFRQNRWIRESCELPDIIYDRSYYNTNDERRTCLTALTLIAARKPYVVLNGGLPSKWDVYTALTGFPRIAPSLPATEIFLGARQLHSMLSLYDKGLFLKPASGMQGKGVLYIRPYRLTPQWIATGRTRNNKLFEQTFDDYSTLEGWITRYIGSTSYIIQPYLELSGNDDKPYDVRALLQKNDKGCWSITGTVVRVGQQGSLTSNLHGGGSALNTLEFLAAKFGTARANKMIDRIKELTIHTAEKLENSFGRLAELGFDFGIEPDGRIWLLEVNSKPGRSSFRLLGDGEAEQRSIEQPLRYARLLSRRIYPFLITNESAIDRHRHHLYDNRLRSDNVQEVHP